MNPKYYIIWFFTGSAARSGSGAEERHVQAETNMNASEHREIQRISTMQISKDTSARENAAAGPTSYPKYDFISLSLYPCFSMSVCPCMHVCVYLSLLESVLCTLCTPVCLCLCPLYLENFQISSVTN